MRKLIGFQLLIAILIALNWQASHIAHEIQKPKEEFSSPKEIKSKSSSNKREISSLAANQAIIKSTINSADQKPKKVLEVEYPKLIELKECYQTNDCPFSQKDSRSYDLEVSQRISNELNHLYNKITSHSLNHEKFSAIAREFMQIDSGHIKEKCLEIFSTQNPSTENLKIIIEHGLHFHSDRLIEHVVMEMRRYQQLGFDHSLEEAFEKVFLTASPAIKEKVAKNIHSFLNEANIEKFTEILDTFPKSSLTYKYLKSSIDRFNLK